MAPQLDETAETGESPKDTAIRLSLAKARIVARTFPEAIIIGADQVADLHGEAIGKPNDRPGAILQLQRLAGQKTMFHSAMALVGQGHADQLVCVSTTVVMRQLDLPAIEAFVDAEPAFDCAGSARIESFGIALMQSVTSDDPSALIGLPLIALVDMLAARGHHVLPRS